MTAQAGARAPGGVIVANAPEDCDDRAFTAMRRRVLADVHALAARALVLDVSRVEILDSVLFSILADTARMAGLLGARTVFAGFQPGVVSALIDLDAPCGDIESALNVEDALALLDAARGAPPDGQDPDGQPAGEDPPGTDGEPGALQPMKDEDRDPE